MTDIRDDLFANCALWAYVEVAIETGQSPPDSERTRRRAYELFEQAKASEPRNGERTIATSIDDQSSAAA
jgi:hypothetical protein